MSSIKTLLGNIARFQGEAGKDYILTDDDITDIVEIVIKRLGGTPIFYNIENNNIILSGNLTDGTYSVNYKNEDGSTTNIGNLVVDSNMYYTVTNNLTQCTTNNSATKVVQGSAYSATITAKSGYELKSVTATMSGSAVSVSNGKINISNVTGNIVITAVAEEVQAAVNLIPLSTDASGNPYNGGQGWKTGYRIRTSTGLEDASSGVECTGFMPVKYGRTLTVEGISGASDGKSNLCFYGTDYALLVGGNLPPAFYNNSATATLSGEKVSVVINTTNFPLFSNIDTSKIAFMRMSGTEITANSVVIVTD